jgi:hypothetical protein
MVEKFLLNLEYECTRQGIAIPWDDIAHRFHPGATGAGVQQHFARLRSVMAAEGHLIPPKIPSKKHRGSPDSTIRGYIRSDIDEDGAIIVRSVKYTEPLEHPTFNKPDAHAIGAYEEKNPPSRKALKRDSAENGEPSSASMSKEPRRRSRVPIKYEDAAESESESESESQSEDEELVVRVEEDDGEDEDHIPFDELPIRDDIDLEDLAMNLYTRNTNPKVYNLLLHQRCEASC